MFYTLFVNKIEHKEGQTGESYPENYPERYPEKLGNNFQAALSRGCCDCQQAGRFGE